MSERSREHLHQWMQPILSGLVLAGVIWVGSEVTNLREDMRAVQEQVTYEARIAQDAAERIAHRVERLESSYRTLRDGAIVEIVRRHMRDEED